MYLKRTTGWLRRSVNNIPQQQDQP